MRVHPCPLSSTDIPGLRVSDGVIIFFPTPTPVSSFPKMSSLKSLSQSLLSLFPRAFGHKACTRAPPLHCELSQRPISARASATLGRHHQAELCRFRHSIVTVSLCRASRWLCKATEHVSPPFLVHFCLHIITHHFSLKPFAIPSSTPVLIRSRLPLLRG
jgi:hypothetical protein